MKFLIDCSLTNASGNVYVNEAGELVHDVAGMDFIGFWHPDGPDKAVVWVSEHEKLAAEAKQRAIEASLAAAADDTLSGSDARNDVDVPEKAMEDSVPAAESVEETKEEAPAAVGEDVVPADEASDEQPVAEDAPAQKTGTLEEDGVPVEFVPLLLAAGLDTKEKVLAHPDLTKVEDIGKATKRKILNGLNGVE